MVSDLFMESGDREAGWQDINWAPTVDHLVELEAMAFVSVLLETYVFLASKDSSKEDLKEK